MITVQEIVDNYNQIEQGDFFDKIRDVTEFIAEKTNETDKERIFHIMAYAGTIYVIDGKNDLKSMAKFIVEHFNDLRASATIQQGSDPENDPTSDPINDPVNHPAHYTSGKFETIDIIQDKLTAEQFEGFCVGNAIKYITRYKLKNGLEDLEKAIWYLNKIVEVKRGKAERL